MTTPAWGVVTSLDPYDGVPFSNIALTRFKELGSEIVLELWITNGYRARINGKNKIIKGSLIITDQNLVARNLQSLGIATSIEEFKTMGKI